MNSIYFKNIKEPIIDGYPICKIHTNQTWFIYFHDVTKLLKGYSKLLNPCALQNEGVKTYIDLYSEEQQIDTTNK